MCLPDRTFFDLMRLYLGEIKTPFNKQRLVERLIGFLSKPEMQNRAASSLDRLDIQILTAIHILPVTTQGALLLFLASEYSVRTRLVNMEERLLIYRSDYEDSENVVGKVYKINPLLYKAVEYLLDTAVFFLPKETGEPQNKGTLTDDLVLIGLYTFFLKNAATLKINGTFKLKTAKQLNTLFQNTAPDSDHIETLCTGLQQLGLLIRNEASLVPQQERWGEFFKRTPFDRKMYLMAAICGHARREILRMRAQFFSDFLTALEPEGIYTDEILKRFFWFLFQKLFFETDKGALIFPFIRTATGDEGDIINTMKGLGFLLPIGEGWQLNTAVFFQEPVEQPLIVSPSFEITALPYTSFEHIFPAFNCAEPVSILTAGRFEITRGACLRCFEKCSTDDELISLLDKAAGGRLPQNIKASIAEWYAQCTAVGLYRGFVLAVAEDKRKLFQQNERLQKIIYKELADGVYLVKQMELEAIRAVVKSTGLEATYYNISGMSRQTGLELIPIERRASEVEVSGEGYQERDKRQFIREKEYRAYLRKLEQRLETLPVSSENKRNLKEKIVKKLILTEEQLCGMPADTEIRAVSGLDFLGKIRLAELVIAGRNLLEIDVEEPSGHRMITGMPIAIEKEGGDAVLLIRGQDDQSYERISVALIVKMRALRDSLFS